MSSLTGSTSSLASDAARSAKRSGRWAASVRAALVIGLAVLANGAALVIHIVRDVPLPPLLLVLWGAGLAAVGVVVMRLDRRTRATLGRGMLVGIGAGFAATLAYDASKAVLSTLDPSPYNPFEAIRVFGIVLIGADNPDGLLRAVGLVFHLSNGITFGLAYTFMFGRVALRGRGRAVALGVAWGLFLETFQLALFPGWMSIQFVAEFQQISFLAHTVFGCALGLLVPAGLRRARLEEGWR